MTDPDKNNAQAVDRDERRLLHHQVTRTIVGAFYTVRAQLGCGFLERVYANAVAVVLRDAGLTVDREKRFDIIFRGQLIGRYRADLVVEDRVIVEAKVGRLINPLHCAQLRNYLRASGIEVGLLLNFGPAADFKRLVSTKQRKRLERTTG